MAVSTTTTYSGPYFPNGVTVAFPFNFKALTASEIEVILEADGVTSTVNPASYNVTLAPEGGTVTFTSAPASGSKLHVTSDPLFTQTAVFSSQAYNPNVLNTLFDRDALRAQHLKGLVDRAVSAPIGEAGLRLPPATERAGRFLTFDAAGKPAMGGGTGADAGLRADLAGDGAVLIGTSSGGTVQDAIDSLPLTPEQFGAVGDGVTDDTDAFVALSAALQAAGGGVVQLRKGAVYRGGRQYTPGGADTMWKRSRSFIAVSNVKSLIVNGNGATFKWLDGLLYGTFNTATGLPQDYGVPYSGYGTAATLESAISIIDVDFFRVSGLKIDGNSTTHLVGGRFGDTGIQLQHYGIFSRRCKNFEADVDIRNVFLDGMALDQSTVDFSTDTMPRPHVISGLIDRVGRNCVSVVGSNKVLVDRANFSRAGEAPNTNPGSLPVTVVAGKLGSAPASCFDIEAELTTNRNITIRNSRLISGQYSNTCFVADSGDSADITIEDSELVGGVWTAKDRTVFRRCKINGKLTKLRGGRPDPKDNTVLEDCVISDKNLGAWPYPGTLLFDMTGAGSSVASPVAFRRCDFTVSRSIPDARSAVFEDCKFHMQAGIGVVPDNSYVMLIDRALMTRPIFYDEIPTGALPTTSFYISGTSVAFITDGRIVPNTAQYKLRWNGVAGYPTAARPDGAWANTNIRGAQLRLNARLGWSGETNGVIMIAAHNVSPASGFWDGAALNGLWPVGSYVRNDTPGSSKIGAWKCTVAPVTPGASGTWVAIVDVEQQTGWTPSTGTANKGAYAVYAGATHGAAYAQAAIQALDDAVKAASQRIKALEDTIRAAGIIN